MKTLSKGDKIIVNNSIQIYSHTIIEKGRVKLVTQDGVKIDLTTNKVNEYNDFDDLPTNITIDGENLYHKRGTQLQYVVHIYQLKHVSKEPIRLVNSVDDNNDPIEYDAYVTMSDGYIRVYEYDKTYETDNFRC